MFQTRSTRPIIAAITLVLIGSTASAAVVTRTFSISVATVADLWSTTFDGGMTQCNVAPPDPQECAFFTGYPVGTRHVVFSNGTAPSNYGFLTVNYEDTTGEILQVTRLRINVPNVTVEITCTDGAHPCATADGSSATITVIQGNSVPAANDFPFVEAGTGTLGRALGGLSGTGKGTVDGDEGVAIGQAGIFQHDDQPNADAPDFATFSDIVDSCVDHTATLVCGLIPLLTLDGVRYRLEGTVNGAGGDSLVLKQQTSNSSKLTVNFTTAAEPADYDGDSVSNASDNCPVTANAGQANADADARGDACDNCTLVANTAAGLVPGLPVPMYQFDSNGEGYGNICDADLNNDGHVTAAGDYVRMRSVLGQPDTASALAADSDMNGDGTVTAAGDYVRLRARLITDLVGPSGLSCAGTFPCPPP